MAYPRFVEFHEEGPREGFQSERTLYPLASRVALVDALTATGLKKIQVASFVNPRMVPAMADAAELFGAIQKKSGVRHTALWLNAKGIEKAMAATAGVDLDGKMMLYASEAFSWSNNGCSAKDQQQRQLEWLAIYDRLNLPLEAVYVATAFGCQMQGEVPLQAVLDIVDFRQGPVRGAKSRPLPSIFLGDTVGWGNPEEIKRRVTPCANGRRGCGWACTCTTRVAWARPISMPPCRKGWICSTAPSAAWAAARSAITPICRPRAISAPRTWCSCANELGIETGIDLDRLIEASRLAEEIIGRTLAGKVMHSDSLDAQRAALRQAQAGSRHERRAAFLGGRRDRHADHQPAGAAQRHQHRGQQPAVRGLGNHRQPSGHPRGHSHLGGLRHLLRRHGLEGGRARQGGKRARTSCGRSRIRSRRACAG